MQVNELKKKLIDKIDLSEDTGLLEEMYRLITHEDSDLSVYELSEDQIIAVKEGQIQYRNGEFLTDKQAEKDILVNP